MTGLVLLFDLVFDLVLLCLASGDLCLCLLLGLVNDVWTHQSSYYPGLVLMMCGLTRAPTTPERVNLWNCYGLESISSIKYVGAKYAGVLRSSIWPAK